MKYWHPWYTRRLSRRHGTPVWWLDREQCFNIVDRLNADYDSPRFKLYRAPNCVEFLIDGQVEFCAPSWHKTLWILCRKYAGGCDG